MGTASEQPDQRIARSIEEAVGVVGAMVRHLASAQNRPVVAICGPVGAGKSTLAHRLSACVLATDDYLPDYHTIAEHERDDPVHADLGALAAHLDSLRRGVAVRAPVWSFKEHRRVGEQLIEPATPVVCEGLFALHDRVLGSVDIAVFIEASRGIRWARWEAIERAGERGMGVERAREHFETVAEPTFARYADAYRSAAHILVINE